MLQIRQTGAVWFPFILVSLSFLWNWSFHLHEHVEGILVSNVNLPVHLRLFSVMEWLSCLIIAE